jgi:hypothetical protein
VTSDALYYFGSKKNEVDSSAQKLQITGFDYRIYDDTTNDTIYEYRVLTPENIFATLLTREDLQELRKDYPNQIIWSEPFILGYAASGFRNFKFINFLNVTTEFGPIIDVRYMGTKLFLFTERGLANVNVGEVLASTASGETFVDSSRFLNSSYFLIRNAPNIERNSIVRYENMLFFSDGKDVWMLTDGLKNISNGSIELDGTGFVGAVDPLHKEYRISDSTQTWAYSWEADSWFGPYTYKDVASIATNQEMFSIVGSELVKHNDSNSFAGETFQTLIESVADDLEDSSIDKTFRKFYLDYTTTGAENLVSETSTPLTDEDGDQLVTEEQTTDFQYAKEYGTWIAPDNTSTKNDTIGVGIKSSASNAKRLFWRFLSDAEDFVVSLVSFEWAPRKRR